MKKYVALLCTLFLTTSAFAAETWSVKEGSDLGYIGNWVKQSNGSFHANMYEPRTGKSNTYVAHVSISENNVRIARRNSSDGNDCNYTAIKYGNFIEGDGVCERGYTKIEIALPSGKK